MKILSKSAQSNLGKAIVSIFLLICVLATKAIHNNNIQVVEAITTKSTVSTQVTQSNTQQNNKNNITKPQHLNRECHIIPTLPVIKQDQHIAFMRCIEVNYNNSTQQYNLQLQDQDSKLLTYSICKSKLNRNFLNNINELFYNQTVITTIDNSTNTIKELNLLDEAIMGEQLSPDSISDEINRLMYKNNVKDHTDIDLWK